ncbi:MAG: hypothetical protein KAW14_02885 [Candidatus Aegiribacteria sp.]|nr:hypothetical protein [Candidatus Aegiribacteria sp.]
MRKMIRLSSILLIPFIVMTACVDTGQSVTQPVTGHSSNWHDGKNSEEICHEYLVSLGVAQSMYYGMYNEFADNIEDLQQFFPYPVDSIYCPVNGEYIFTVDDENYCIACPSNQMMSHGNILNGVVSWPPDPSEYLEVCRSNMMSLASGCAMYYGLYNCYPGVLSDLEEVMGNWDMECPACASIYMYETNPEGDSYTITCPLPTDPNHGSVVDGYISW